MQKEMAHRYMKGRHFFLLQFETVTSTDFFSFFFKGRTYRVSQKLWTDRRYLFFFYIKQCEHQREKHLLVRTVPESVASSTLTVCGLCCCPATVAILLCLCIQEGRPDGEGFGLELGTNLLRGAAGGVEHTEIGEALLEIKKKQGESKLLPSKEKRK